MIDVYMPFAAASGIMLMIVPVLVFVGFGQDALPNDPLWVAVVFLSLIGAVGTAIQGFFYKIATFLVWLKRYAPVAGKQKSPKLEEMYNRNLAMVGFGVWLTAVVAGTVVLLLDIEAMWVVGVGLMVGAGCFLANVVLIARHWWRGPQLRMREPVISRQPHLRTR